MTATPTWRDGLAREVALVGTLAIALSAVATLLLPRSPMRIWVSAAVLGLACAFGVAGWARGISEHARGWLVVGAFFATTMVAYAAAGFLSGPAMSLALTMVLGGLLLGRRSVVILLGLAAAGMTTIGWAMVTGRLAAPMPEDVSLFSSRVWMRTGFVTLLSVTVLVSAVLAVVARMEAGAVRVAEVSALRVAAERERAEIERVASQSQKLEAVGRLAAGVAHDLNNVLTVVQSWNDLIAREHSAAVDPAAATLASPDWVSGHKAIRAAVDQAAGLIRQLLVLGRRDVPQPREIDLRKLVESFRNTLGRALPSDIAIVTEHAGDARVMADDVQMNQVLLNLVLNARDAIIARGQGGIVVRTHAQTLGTQEMASTGPLAAGRWAVLEVEDDGQGIDAAIVSRVFEPFFTTKGPDRGTGLGLSTVASIAAAAGGAVRLQSEPGRGTKVSVWLPAVQQGASSSVVASVTPPSPINGLIVLFAEDHPLILAALTATLEAAGAKVLAARDGTEAMTIVEREKRLDVVCTDVVMPGTPVSQVLARAAKLHPRARVVVCSGHVDEDITRRGIEVGRYRFLAKPFSPDDLVRAIAETMRA